jgi:hydroxypyruvate isomerase
MPRFAANLSMLWPELDLYDRFAAAAAAGFSRVEIQFIHRLDLGRLEHLLREHRLHLVLFNPAAGDWDAGERGVACNPGREKEFARNVSEGLHTAGRLGNRRLNVLTGIPVAGVTEAEAHRKIVENFLAVAGLAAANDVLLLIENINTTDSPGFYVNTVERAASIVSEVGHPNVRLQFDQYHVGMMGGDPRETLHRYRDLVEHVQIADVPGRHEPGTGQQPIGDFLSDLDALGYAGTVGLEYRPLGATESGLTWLPVTQRS